MTLLLYICLTISISIFSVSIMMLLPICKLLVPAEHPISMDTTFKLFCLQVHLLYQYSIYTLTMIPRGKNGQLLQLLLD